MKISAEEFYERCSTEYLESLLEWQLSGENRRIIKDILEVRKGEKTLDK